MSEQAGFEQALKELEKRVRGLESGEATLEESLKLFEEGVTLARQCHDELQVAEERVSRLSRGMQGVESAPMDEPSEAG